MFRVTSTVILILIVAIPIWAQNEKLVSQKAEVKNSSDTQDSKAADNKSKQPAKSSAESDDVSVSSWVITIKSYGGVFGVGNGSYQINSDGKIYKLDGLTKAADVQVSPDLLTKTSEFVNNYDQYLVQTDGKDKQGTAQTVSNSKDSENSEVEIALITASKRNVMCSDCYSYSMRVTRVRLDGKVAAKTFGWNDVTFAELPKSAINSYKEVMQIIESKF